MIELLRMANYDSGFWRVPRVQWVKNERNIKQRHGIFQLRIVSVTYWTAIKGIQTVGSREYVECRVDNNWNKKKLSLEMLKRFLKKRFILPGKWWNSSLEMQKDQTIFAFDFHHRLQSLQFGNWSLWIFFLYWAKLALIFSSRKKRFLVKMLPFKDQGENQKVWKVRMCQNFPPKISHRSFHDILCSIVIL